MVKSELEQSNSELTEGKINEKIDRLTSINEQILSSRISYRKTKAYLDIDGDLTIHITNLEKKIITFASIFLRRPFSCSNYERFGEYRTYSFAKMSF